MKLVEDNEVILGNAGSTSKFKIAASSKAFKILSSGLYKNKIRAVVRELTCNVVDAHKLNGSKDPFEIKAPTQLDPRFVIRDFGPGLNEEDIVDLYSTYFASTKSNSNDFIGALGLGSKSPFSYTDTFTVVSYNGGMVRGFTAMLDGGEPALRKVFEEEMKEGEKTGIEITVPVKQPDIQRWHQEIRYVLRTFNTWPHVIKGCTPPDYFPAREGKNSEWFTANSDEGAGLYAVYGNIVYPLNDIPGLQKPWMRINHSAVYIHFELGELDIAASREELSLDENTIANIIERVNALSKIAMADTVKRIEAIDNGREFLRELDHLSYEARNIILTSSTSIKDRARAYETQYKVPAELEGVGVVYDISIDTKMKRIKANRGAYGRFQGYSLDSLFKYDVDTINILIDDKPSKRVKVIRGLAYQPKQTLRGRIVVYREDDEEQMEAFELVKKLFDKDTVNVLRVSECDDIIANVPVADSGPKEKRPASPNVQTYKLGPNGYHDVESFRMTTDELKELEGLTILRKRDDFHDFPSQKFVNGLNEHNLYALCRAFKIKEFHVIRSTVVDRLVKYDAVESLLDEIREKSIKLVDEVDYDQYVGSPQYGSRMINVCKRENNLKFILDYFTVSGKTSDKAQLLNSIQDCFGWNVDSKDDMCVVNKIVTNLRRSADKDATDILKKFEEKYPTVSYILNNCYSIKDGMVDDIKKLLN